MNAQPPGEKALPANTPTDRQHEWMKATDQERIQLAERIGEEGAHAFAAKQGYKPLLTKGDKSLSQGFDQVYQARDGSIVVIEAKGGTSPLGRAYGCQQGTPEWAVQAARRVTLSTKASAAEKQAARLVLEAARDGKLTVQVVRTRHVLGKPLAAVVETTLKVTQAEGKVASVMLKEVTVTTKMAGSVSRAATTAKAASKVAAGARSLSSVAKAAGVAGVAVDGAMRAASAIDTEQKYQAGEITQDERITAHAKNAAGMAGGLSGAWAGAEAGAIAGGSVGVFFGGVGAPIGAAVGGTVGAVTGYLGGEFLGERIVDAVSWMWK